jgi:hypothetical protein
VFNLLFAKPGMRVADLETRVSNLGMRVADLGMRVFKLKKRVADLETRVFKLEKRVADLGMRVFKLEKRVAGLQDCMCRVILDCAGCFALSGSEELLIFNFIRGITGAKVGNVFLKQCIIDNYFFCC